MSAIVPPPSDLTLALVGKRVIDPRWRSAMEDDLVLAFDALDEGLGATRGGSGATLTLITGLADGADRIAGDLFLAGGGGGVVARVLGAIVPCAIDAFARNGPVRDVGELERAAKTCAFVTVLDGRLPPPPPEGPGAEAIREVRRDVFAAQADALLKAADLLIAVDDPDDVGDVGGTRHTLGRALGRGLPVLLIHLGRSGVRLLAETASDAAMKPLHGDLARSTLATFARDVAIARASAPDDGDRRSARPPGVAKR